MHTLPFVPSERPLIRHMSLMRNCLNLMSILHNSDDDDDAFVSVEFVAQMMDSMECCKGLWEEIRKDAVDAGLEPDDPALQMKSIDPYRYEYNFE